MAKINCSVQSCSYNKNNDCYAGIVKIGGKTASDIEQTCCGSFLSKEAYSNLAEYTSMRNEGNEILCNVSTCEYHQNDHCSLPKIQVGGKSNSTVYTETECTSFKKA